MMLEILVRSTEDQQNTAQRTLFLLEWRASRYEPVVTWTVKHGHMYVPAVGRHKTNADGAFPRNLIHGGGSMVLTDHHGRFVSGAYHYFSIRDRRKDGGDPSLSVISSTSKGGKGFKVCTRDQ
jgi:hypothetical protein